MSEPDVNAVAQALAAPFDAADVKFKPQTVSGNRALAIPFVDARAVMDRLDAVLGVMGWQDSYEVLPDGAVVCRLKLKVGGEWITKEDVGGQSEQPDEGDRRKAAFCLPLDAEALTLDGWTTYDRIRAGDLILGYDMAAGVCRWTPALSVNVFDAPQELWSLSSKSFNMACTPAHRWVVNRRNAGMRIKPTDRLDTLDRIVVAAPAEPGSHQLTEREAAIVGWLATDGSVSQFPDGRRGPQSQQFHAFIHQSKPDTRAAVRDLLGSDAVEHTTPPGHRLFPGKGAPSPTLERAAFRLHTGFAQALLSRAGLYDGAKADWRKLSGLVTRLSAAARESMFQAMMDGDGQHSASGQLKFGKKRKPGVMEAFEILATLKGVALGTLHSSDEPGRVPLRTLRQNPHTWHKCIEVGPAAPEAVWCPTTELGTWVTRWGGQITITGNSDALKRAAVKFGVGRYLYRSKPQWVDYDPQKRQILKPPPPPGAPAQAAPAAAKPQPAQAGRVSEAASAAGIPDPREAERRVYAFEGKMVEDGLCKAGEVVSRLTRVHGELWRQTPLDAVAATCKAFRKEREENRAKAAAR